MKSSTHDIIENLHYRIISLDIFPVIETIELLVNRFKNDKKLLICGNGGSSSDSQHIVGEFMKSFNKRRFIPNNLSNKIKESYPNDYDNFRMSLQVAFPAISLSNEIALYTAFCNDVDANMVFAQQVLGYGKEDDVLLPISTSGNSKNVINACKIAKVLGLKVIGLTGDNGGELNNVCDIVIKAPSNITYRIQEYHIMIYHAICLAVENEFFGED